MKHKIKMPKAKAKESSKDTFKMRDPNGQVHEIHNSHRGEVENIMSNGGDVGAYIMKFGGAIKKAKLGVQLQPISTEPVVPVDTQTGLTVGKKKLVNTNATTDAPVDFNPNYMNTFHDNLNQAVNSGDVKQIDPTTNNQVANISGGGTFPINQGQHTYYPKGYKNNVAAKAINSGVLPKNKSTNNPYNNQNLLGLGYGNEFRDFYEASKITRGMQSTDKDAPNYDPNRQRHLDAETTGMVGAGSKDAIRGTETVANIFATDINNINVKKSENSQKEFALRNTAPINTSLGDSRYGTTPAYSKHGGKIKIAKNGTRQDIQIDEMPVQTQDLIDNEFKRPDGMIDLGGKKNVEAEGGEGYNDGKSSGVLHGPTHENDGIKIEAPDNTVFHSKHIGLSVGDMMAMAANLPGGDYFNEKLAQKYKDPEKAISYNDAHKLFLTTKKEGVSLDNKIIKLNKDAEKAIEVSNNNNYNKIDKFTNSFNATQLNKKAGILQKEKDARLFVTGSEGPLYKIAQGLKENGAYGEEIQNESKAKYGKKIKLQLPKAALGRFVNGVWEEDTPTTTNDTIPEGTVRRKNWLEGENGPVAKDDSGYVFINNQWRSGGVNGDPAPWYFGDSLNDYFFSTPSIYTTPKQGKQITNTQVAKPAIQIKQPAIKQQPVIQATSNPTNFNTQSNQSTSDGWKNEWTQRILAHERKAGAPGGVGFKKGYNDEDWTGENAAKFQVYIDAAKAEVPNFDKLPDGVKASLVDYKFNNGNRSIKDLLLRAEGKITGDQLNSNEKFSFTPNFKLLENPSFVKKIAIAKEDAYLSKAEKNKEGFQGNFDNNFFPRAHMWDDMAPTIEDNSQKVTTPVQAQVPLQNGIQSTEYPENAVQTMHRDPNTGEVWYSSVPSKTSPFDPKYNAPYNPATNTPTGFGDPVTQDKIRENTALEFPNATLQAGVDPKSTQAIQQVQKKYSPLELIDAYTNGYLRFNNKHKELLQSLKEYQKLGRKGDPLQQDYQLLIDNPALILKGHEDNMWGKDAIKYETIKFDEGEEWKYDAWRKDQRPVGTHFIDKDYTQSAGMQPTYWNADISAFKEKVPDPKKPYEINVPKAPGITESVRKRMYHEGLHPDQYLGDMMDLLDPKQAVPYIEDHGAKDALAMSTKQRYTDIQPQLNRLRRGTLAQTRNRGTSPVDQARNAQAYANEYEQANQVYGQKYNADNQIEQNYNNIQNELRMKAGTNKAQALDTLAQRTATRDWKATAQFRNAVANIGNKRAQQRLEDRTSTLYQDMYPDFGYNPYTGTRYQGDWAPTIGGKFPYTGKTEKNWKEEERWTDGDGHEHIKRTKHGGKVSSKPLPKKMPKKR